MKHLLELLMTITIYSFIIVLIISFELDMVKTVNTAHNPYRIYHILAFLGVLTILVIVIAHYINVMIYLFKLI